LCGLRSPRGESIKIFQDLYRDLIIIFERLSGRGLEGFHASVAVTRRGDPIRLEVEPISMDDTEEDVVVLLRSLTIPTLCSACERQAETLVSRAKIASNVRVHTDITELSHGHITGC
jgi:hypothetical protein